MHPHRRPSCLRLASLGAAAALGAACALLAGAAAPPPASQPAPSPAPAPTTKPDAQQPDAARPDAGRFRERVRENMVQRLERTQQALAMLDGGASLEDVRAKYPDVMRWMGRGGGGGGGGPDGPPPDGMDGPRGPGGGWGGSGGPGGPGGPGGGGRDREMTAEDKAVMLTLLKEAEPEMAKMLAELEKTSPDEANERYQRLFYRMRPLVDMHTRDPALARAKTEEFRTAKAAFGLARDYIAAKRSGAADSDLATKRTALRDAVAVHLRARLESMRRERDRMAEDIAECEQKMDAEVDRRVTEMLEREQRRSAEREKSGDQPGTPSQDRPRPDRN